MRDKPCDNCGSYGGNVGCDVCGPAVRKRKNEQLEYAALQHDLCCHHLGINPNHDEPGDTLLEAICKIESNHEEKLARIAELATHDDHYWAIEEIGRLCEQE